MAIVALATSREDLEQRLGQHHRRRHRGRVATRRCAPRELKALGRDGDAAQGRDSPEPRADARRRAGVRARRAVRQHRARLQQHPRDPRRRWRSPTSSSPKPGFGSDLGAEKFFDIKCRVGGLNPEAAVLVATVRSLKMQGGADKRALGVGDLAALERGLPHLEHHIENVQPVRRPRRRRDQPVPGGHGGRAADGHGLRRAARRQGRALPRCGRRAARAARRSRARCWRSSRPARRELRADLRRRPAGPGEDRDDRQAGLWRRRRRLHAGGGPRHRSARDRSACSTRRCAWRRRSTR